MERKIKKIKKAKNAEATNETESLNVNSIFDELFGKVESFKKQVEEAEAEKSVDINSIMKEVFENVERFKKVDNCDTMEVEMEAMAKKIFKTVASIITEEEHSKADKKPESQGTVILTGDGKLTDIFLSEKMVVNVTSKDISFDDEYPSQDSEIIRNILADSEYAEGLSMIRDEIGNYSLNTYVLRNLDRSSQIALIEINSGVVYPLQGEIDFLIVDLDEDTGKVVVPTWLNPSKCSFKKIVYNKHDYALIKDTMHDLIKPLKPFFGSNKSFAIVHNTPYFLVSVEK